MKQFICLMLFALAMTSARACDVCGCSANSQYLGLLPDVRWNFIGFQYEQYHFKSSYPSLFDSKRYEKASQYYNTLQSWGRYNLAKRLQMFAFAPYKINIHDGDSLIKSSGIGDVSMLVNFVVLREKQNTNWQQQLLAGGGIKLPTGSYKGINELDREGLPNTQAGTGSYDFLLNANYTIHKKNIGANIDAAYTMTTANKYNYKYGNRLNSGLMFFYALKNKKAKSILPQTIPIAIGMRYEHALHDYDNYQKKWLNEETGGYMCFAVASVQAYYKRIGLRCTFQLPVGQHYSAGYVTAQYKFDTGIFLLF